MNWKPVTLDELNAQITAGLAHADDAVRAAWEKIRIEPQKWQCSPWGDDGGGFWAVAISDGTVVWFNDIEDGFNVSPFKQHGTIGEYYCNQDDFGTFLMALPEAKAAEDFAESAPSSPTHNVRGPGRIGRRQTTYWEIHPTNGVATRIHFSGKKEMRFVEPDYAAVAVTEAHPVLVQYQESWVSLFVKGVPRSVSKLLEAVAARVASVTAGWRHANEYLAHGGPTTDVLKAGNGRMMEGPESIVHAVADELPQHGVTPSIIKGWTPKGPMQALLLGKNFVVAKAFRFEQLAPQHRE